MFAFVLQGNGAASVDEGSTWKENSAADTESGESSQELVSAQAGNSKQGGEQ